MPYDLNRTLVTLLLGMDGVSTKCFVTFRSISSRLSLCFDS